MDVEHSSGRLYSHQSSDSTDNWVILGRHVPKGEIVFLCQYLVITIVIVSSIVNIALGNNTETFLSLLSLSLGAILPNPKLKSKSKFITRPSHTPSASVA